MNTTNFYVTGMKCDGCIKKANTALQDVPGFESADYDLKEGTASVVGDVDPQAVAMALTEIGYPATVKSG